MPRLGGTVSRLTSEYVTTEVILFQYTSPNIGRVGTGDGYLLGNVPYITDYAAAGFSWATMSRTRGSVTQKQYRIWIADEDGTVVYDTQWVTSALTSININLGVNGILSNHEYQWKVALFGTVNVGHGNEAAYGESEWATFFTAFAPAVPLPPITALRAIPIAGCQSRERGQLPGILVQWTITAPNIFSFAWDSDTGALRMFEVRRRELGPILPSDWIPVARGNLAVSDYSGGTWTLEPHQWDIFSWFDVMNGGVNYFAYYDWSVKSRVPYEYTVVFYTDREVTSEPETMVSPQAAPVTGMVEFDETFVHAVNGNKPGALFGKLIRNNYSETNEPLGRFDLAAAGSPELYVSVPSTGSVQDVQDVVISPTWGRTAPTAFFGEALYHQIELRGLDQLRRDPAMWRKLENLLAAQAGGDILCIRTGLDRQLYFVVMDQLGRAFEERSWAGNLRMSEVDYDEDIGPYEHVPFF